MCVPEPQVLIPFDLREAITLADAAYLAGRTPETVRNWAVLHGIGRRIGGRWMISKVALAMFLDGAASALRAYLAGDRIDPAVTAYFTRFGLSTGSLA